MFLCEVLAAASPSLSLVERVEGAASAVDEVGGFLPGCWLVPHTVVGHEQFGEVSELLHGRRVFGGHQRLPIFGAAEVDVPTKFRALLSDRTSR